MSDLADVCALAAASVAHKHSVKAAFATGKLCVCEALQPPDSDREPDLIKERHH